MIYTQPSKIIRKTNKSLNHYSTGTRWHSASPKKRGPL